MTNKDVVTEVKEAIRKVNEILDKNESDLQSLKLRLSISDKLYEMRWEYASTKTPKKDELNNVQGSDRIFNEWKSFQIGNADVCRLRSIERRR